MNNDEMKNLPPFMRKRMIFCERLEDFILAESKDIGIEEVVGVLRLHIEALEIASRRIRARPRSDRRRRVAFKKA